MPAQDFVNTHFREINNKTAGANYRYESDAIEMLASLLKPLANALDTLPNELMD